MLSRVVKGTVYCDLGWAEVTESLLFISSGHDTPGSMLRFPLPPRSILHRQVGTGGGGKRLVHLARSRPAG